MSTKVNLEIALLAAKNTLSRDDMIKTFNSCVEELGFKIINNFLSVSGKIIGKLSIKDRIVLSIESGLEKDYTNEIELLRSRYAMSTEVLQKNYLSHKKALLEKEMYSSSVYNKLKQEIELEEAQMKRALIRQRKDACEAIKDELIEAALNNGYEVEQSINKDNNIQLQLVRREY